eukprot:TRINITY_DN45028_c0_g1_i1.p1 TRINITY_DN45028_c0_g1~~TRINITY_DN45028_c0_g1_i1.p1  ORF type:complete len:478 (+),score=23.35 TRINITY_DN45028_c0_g1_i1:100-1533(+)
MLTERLATSPLTPSSSSTELRREQSVGTVRSHDEATCDTSSSRGLGTLLFFLTGFSLIVCLNSVLCSGVCPARDDAAESVQVALEGDTLWRKGSWDNTTAGRVDDRARIGYRRNYEFKQCLQAAQEYDAVGAVVFGRTSGWCGFFRSRQAASCSRSFEFDEVWFIQSTYHSLSTCEVFTGGTCFTDSCLPVRGPVECRYRLCQCSSRTCSSRSGTCNYRKPKKTSSVLGWVQFHMRSELMYWAIVIIKLVATANSGFSAFKHIHEVIQGTHGALESRWFRLLFSKKLWLGIEPVLTIACYLAFFDQMGCHQRILSSCIAATELVQGTLYLKCVASGWFERADDPSSGVAGKILFWSCPLMSLARCVEGRMRDVAIDILPVVSAIVHVNFVCGFMALYVGLRGEPSCGSGYGDIFLPLMLVYVITVFQGGVHLAEVVLARHLGCVRCFGCPLFGHAHDEHGDAGVPPAQELSYLFRMD